MSQKLRALIFEGILVQDPVPSVHLESEPSNGGGIPLTQQELQAKAILNVLFNQAKDENGLKQTDLEDMTGYSQGTISNHLTGKARLKKKQILIYAKAFGVPPAMFDPALAYLNPKEEMRIIDSDLPQALDEKAPVLDDPEQILQFTETGRSSAAEDIYLLPHLRGRKVFAVKGGGLNVPDTTPDDYLLIDREFRPEPLKYGLWNLDGRLQAGRARTNNGVLYLIPTPPFEDSPIYLGDWDDRFLGKIAVIIRLN